MPIDGYRREDALDFLLTQFDKAITPVLATIDERLGNKLKEFDLSKFVNAYIEDYQDYAKSRIAYAQHYGFKHKGYNADDPKYKEEIREAGEAYFSNRLFECACNQIGIAELLEEQLQLKDNELLATIFNQVNKYNVNDFLYASPIEYGDKTAENEQSFRQLLLNGIFEDMAGAYENPVDNEKWFDFISRNAEMAEKIASENKIDLVVNGENKSLTLNEIAHLVIDSEYANTPVHIQAVKKDKELEQASGYTL